MRVYRLNSTGSLEGLVKGDEPKPVPRAGEVLVRVRATSLNFRDRLLVLGQHPLPAKSGVVPLADASGEIEAVGDRVTRFAVGDRVISTFFPDSLGGRPTQTPKQYGIDGWLVARLPRPAGRCARTGAAAAPAMFRRVEPVVVDWKKAAALGPDASLDMVLTFRSEPEAGRGRVLPASPGGRRQRQKLSRSSVNTVEFFCRT